MAVSVNPARKIGTLIRTKTKIFSKTSNINMVKKLNTIQITPLIRGNFKDRRMTPIGTRMIPMDLIRKRTGDQKAHHRSYLNRFTLKLIVIPENSHRPQTHREV
ncbi:MAG: hypothetical protein JEY99_20390 [Spirochaetales bacterium]|nr:hypothetical protein [Spirochaetales bacterium]